MQGFMQPRVGGAAGHRVPGVGWLVCLLALVFYPALARAEVEGRSGTSNFDPLTVKLIRDLGRKRAAVLAPTVEDLPPLTEADRVRDGSAAIEEALRASGVKTPGPRDVEREYQDILDAEVRALGREAADLEPEVPLMEEEVVPDPLDRPPSPRRIVHQGRVGLDDASFRPTGVSPITTQQIFGEYRLIYDNQPSRKTHVQLDGSLFNSTLRRSAIASFGLDHRFNRRYTGNIGGTALLERWDETLLRNDGLLGSGYANVVMHLPEQLDFSLRHTFQSRLLDQISFDSPSTLNHRTEFRVEKRMHGGTARFGYVDHQLDVPADPTAEFAHTIVLAGYTAPIHRKVDVDYAYIRLKEARNFDEGDTGDFVQTNNQINVLWRFSHAMSLSFDIDTEDRNYMIQDAIFVSYRRTLLAPTFTVQQTPNLAYNFGYAAEIYNHSPVAAELFFDPRQNDSHNSRYSAGLSYAKKRISAVASVAMAPTTYKLPGILQSSYRTFTTAATLLYDFDSDTRATASYNRINQEFDAIASDNVSENILAEVARKF